MGQLGISGFDRMVVDELRRAYVLDDIEASRFDQNGGVILVCCGDGDQWWDKFRWMVVIYRRFHSRTQKKRWVWPRVHVISVNGGALNIPARSPMCDVLPMDLVVLKQIRDARDLKGMRTIAALVHFPCGAACVEDLDALRVAEMTFDAKSRVREENADAVVAAFGHVDYGPIFQRQAEWIRLFGARMRLFARLRRALDGFADWLLRFHKQRTYIFNRERWDAWRVTEKARALYAERSA